MSQGDDIYLGQWFHPVLNPPAFEDLMFEVNDSTDLKIRRKNHRVGNQFNDVSSKLEVSRFHSKSALDRIEFARRNLKVMLADLSVDLETNVVQHRRVALTKNLIVEFRDHVLVAHLEGLLIQTKCLLDSLSQFYSIAFGRSIKSFSDKGRNVLKDLQNLKTAYAREAEEMTAMIKEAKTSWVDEAIDYRDELVHFGQLREFRCLHLPLSQATRYQSKDVLDSTMPNKRHTEEYLQWLLRSSHGFSAAWLTFIFAQLRTGK